MRPRTARAGELALGAASAVGALCLLAVLLCAVTGMRPVAFRSGSMGPTIPAGSLALAERVSAGVLRVGDVVTVPTGHGSLVTHRVVEVAQQGAMARLRLKGDANASPDPRTYTVDHAERVVASVPVLGHVVGWATRPLGLVLLTLYALAMVRVLLPGSPGPGRHRPVGSPARRRSGRSGRGRHRPARSPLLPVGAVAVALALDLGGSPAAEAAPWVNPTTVTGTTLTSGTVSTPATFTCGGIGLFSVTFTWSAVSGATGYTLHYGSGGSTTATTTGTSATITALISGGTAWVTASIGSWSSGASPTRSYTVAVVSVCS